MKGHMQARIMNGGCVGEREGDSRRLSWERAERLHLITTTLPPRRHRTSLGRQRRLGSFTAEQTTTDRSSHEAHCLGAAGCSNLVISPAHCMRSTRWRSSPQSHRKTQSAQLKTQQAREHHRELDAVQLGGHQLLCECHPWGCFFLSTDWCVRSATFS
jgi:hypothetical protein